MTDDLSARILERILQARDEANASSELGWSRIYAQALDDIGGIIGIPLLGGEPDELAELIAELRSPFRGLGGMSSRSIADTIRAKWALVPHADICPNPDRWPVHSPGASPRDCPACTAHYATERNQ